MTQHFFLILRIKLLGSFIYSKERPTFVASLSTLTTVPMSVCILPKEFSFLPP